MAHFHLTPLAIPLLATTLSLLLLALAPSPTQGGEIATVNNCPWDIWVGYHISDPSDNGRFKLSRGQRVVRQWRNGNIFGLTGCDGNGQQCDTPDSGKISLFEFNWAPPNYERSWYDISAVDGYNIKISAAPYNSNDGGSRCKSLTCDWRFWESCPNDLRVYRGDKVATCQSPCSRYGPPGAPPYCDRSPQNNAYTQAIKGSCGNNIYTYPSDDLATFNCERNNQGFTVTFC